MNGSIFEVIVIGAGQSGLCVSYYLKHLGLEHIIFERGRIGESWRSQRWDNFKMITMSKMNVLPGSTAKLKMPEELPGAAQFVTSLQEYVTAFHLPVAENSTVLSIEKLPGAPHFSVKVMHDNEIVRVYDCWQVIIASGALNEKKLPLVSTGISSRITQIHSSEYRNALQLKEGAVLVVGGGQSGCEIADDLVEYDRKVFISAGPVPRLPRRYRGKDIIEWLILTRAMDVNIKDVAIGEALQDPLISTKPGNDVDLSLPYLSSRGVSIFGTLEKAEGVKLLFRSNAMEAARFADGYAHALIKMIDEFVETNQIEAPTADQDVPQSVHGWNFMNVNSLDLEAENINTIVWATGFTPDFSYIKLPVLDNTGNLIHDQGVTSAEGLYVVGLPWQKTRKSGFVFGVKEDAAFVTNRVYSALR